MAEVKIPTVPQIRYPTPPQIQPLEKPRFQSPQPLPKADFALPPKVFPDRQRAKMNMLDPSNPYQFTSLFDVVAAGDSPYMERWGATEWMDKNLPNVPFFKKLALIGSSATQYFYEGFIQPWQGDASTGEKSTAFFFNTLFGLEAFDFLNFPKPIVRAFQDEDNFLDILKASGRNLNTFYGWSDGPEGRENFDIDLKLLPEENFWGNMAINTMGEILVDPLVWVALIKGAGAFAAKKAGVTAIKTVAKTTPRKVATTLSRRFIRALNSKSLKDTAEALAQAFRTVTDDVNITNKLGVEEDEFLKAVPQIVKQFEDSVGYKMLNSIQSLVKVSDKVDSILMKTTLASSGVLPVWLLARKGGRFIHQNYVNNLIKTLRPYTYPDKTLDLTQLPEIIDTVENASVIYNRYIKRGDLPTFVRHMIKNTMDLEINTILKIMSDNHKKPTDQLNALNAYLTVKQIGTGVDNLTTYVNTLKKVNQNYSGALDALINFYDDFIDQYKALTYYVKDETSRTVLSEIKSETKEFVDLFTELGRVEGEQVGERVIGTSIYEDKLEQYLKVNRQYLANTVLPSNLKGYALENVPQDLEVEVPAQWLPATFRTFIGNVNEGGIGDTFRSYYGEIGAYFKGMHELLDQLKYIKRDTQETVVALMHTSIILREQEALLLKNLREVQDKLYKALQRKVDRFRREHLGFTAGQTYGKRLVPVKALRSLLDPGLIVRKAFREFKDSLLDTVDVINAQLDPYIAVAETLKPVPPQLDFLKSTLEQGELYQKLVGKLLTDHSAYIKNWTTYNVDANTVKGIQTKIFETIDLEQIEFVFRDLNKLPALQEQIGGLRNSLTKNLNDYLSFETALFEDPDGKVRAMANQRYLDIYFSLEQDISLIRNTLPKYKKVKNQDVLTNVEQLVSGPSEFSKALTVGLTSKDTLDDTAAQYISVLNKYAKSGTEAQKKNANKALAQMGTMVTRPLDKVRIKASQMLNSLDEIDTLLADAHPATIVAKDMDLSAEGKWYQLQQEKLWSTLHLVLLDKGKNTKSFPDTMRQIHKGEGVIGSWIHSLAKLDPLEEANRNQAHLIETAKEFLNLAEGYNHYITLLEKVNTAQYLTSNEKQFLLSTLQNYAQMRTSNFPQMTNIVTNTMVNRINSALYTHNMKGSLSLDNLYKTDSKIQEMAKSKGYDPYFAHDAAYDTTLLEAVVEVRLPKLLEQYKGGRITYLDIETTAAMSDLGRAQGSVTQIGYKDHGVKDPTSITRTITEAEFNQLSLKESFLDVFFKDKDMTYEEKVLNFKQMYSKGDFDTEEMMLRSLDVHLKTLNPDTDVVIVHNADNFDIPYLIQSFEKYGIPTDRLRQTNFVDSLTLMKEKEKIPVLSGHGQMEVKQLIGDYIENMSKANVDNLVTPVNQKLSSRLNSLSIEALELSSKDPVFAHISADLGSFGREIILEMQRIKRVNFELATTKIHQYWAHEYDVFTDDFIPEARQDMLSYVEQSVQESGIYTGKNPDGVKYTDIYPTFDAFLEGEFSIRRDDGQLKGYLSLQQYLSIASHNGVSMHGTKVWLDPVALRDWTTIPLKVVKSDQADYLTRLAKRLNKKADTIRNPALLEGYEDEVRISLGKLLDFYKVRGTTIPDNNIYHNLQTLRRDKVAVKDNWVALEYVHYVYTEVFKADLTSFYADVPDEIAGLLKEPDLLFKFQNPKEMTIDSRLESSISYHKVGSAFRTGEIKMNELARSLELADNRLMRDSAIDISAAQGEAAAMMFNLKKYYDAGLQDAVAKKKYDEIMDIGRQVVDKAGQQQTLDFLTADVNTILATVVHYGPIITLDSLGYHNDVWFRNAELLFLEKKDALKAIGIVVEEIEGRYFIGPAKDVQLNVIVDENQVSHKTFNGTVIPEPEYPVYDYSDLINQLPDDLKENYTKLMTQIQRLNGRPLLYDGHTITNGAARTFYYGLPESFRNNVLHIDILGQGKFFNKLRPNFMNLGTTATKKTYDPYTPATIFSSLKNTLIDVFKQAETRLQYTELFYQKEFSFKNDELLKGMSDEQIAQMFTDNQEFTAAALVENKKFGYEVIEIPLRTAENVAHAKRLNAIIVPYTTYLKSYSVINKFEWNNNVMKMWHRGMIMLKLGYLASVGTAVRNYIDGTVKNMVDTKDPINVFAKQATSIKLLMEYNSIIKQVIDLDPHGRFLKTNLEMLFNPQYKYNPGLTFAQYQLVDNYLYGPSGSIAGTPWDFYFWKRQVEADTQPSTWDTTLFYSRQLLTFTQMAEQVNRLSELLVLMDQGVPQLQAYKKILGTHFDYSKKTAAERYIELVVPFYSFTLKNVEWFIESVGKHPWLARTYKDLMWAQWDFDGVSERELQQNRSLHYHIGAGNMQLNSAGLTLKLNPSIMDVASIMFNPVNALPGKVAGPIRQGVQAVTGAFRGEDQAPIMDTLSNVVPIAGTGYQRFQTGAKSQRRTGSFAPRIAPSLVGSVNRYEAYTDYRRGYQKMYHRNTYTRPKHIKNVYRDYYTKTGKSRLKLRTLPITPNTVHYQLKRFWHYLK